ncbi:3-hydroxyacyl-CoA dehydrogenase / enoyl-CoA hydratase / 3-hydroxybutyryl-CoA epimerase [Jatrophihabitans endophyticus]|uniref:3-hydroxyacyl-CoA dehydrogenase / enoyl-CoA hydratase / 3-hydroxybutyryl-CoA epimerase n=1 Tax=Jatrophihabitans endophyticus TaxID=1206085 RepID=A0A1M5D334_9ACTN|nr:3-hydroxyacyl-CoA dehydrogenase NAD-binding domain-containing protein [Jatrophihabitans endophyticus]SHF61409.1 3-hydroxyacyl-CoA dehydrogenase / enoyl-CoA hydratase / 3-hydroxybutyryl-CoA epimerase [Jatrophihabitans endophyticus]
MSDVIRYDKDADGVVTLTLDDPNARANTMNDDFRSSLSAVVDRLEGEDGLTGVIVTSAKDTFFAGGDLKALIRVTDDNVEEFEAGVNRIKADFRRLEKLGKPTVAALNGAALGGGLEIALACNRRIALDNPKSQFGLPEVTLGLLPGAGGVTRITRLLGVADGLMKVLLQGTRYKVAEAVEVGIVDEVAASPEALLAQAREWIEANPETQQPWDVKGYRMPGGAPTSPKLGGMLPAFPGNLKKQLKGAPMPAPHHIMCASVEGATVDFDTALVIEGRYFVNLAKGQVAKNMIQAFWFDLNSINGGGSRPDGHEKRLPTKVAVLGAGMMGAGIAYVTARNGVDVVLKDVSLEAAERGKGYSQKLLDKAVSRGKITQEKADEVLARITPTADYADLAGTDLVVEAVFEKVSLKHEVFAEVEKVVGDDALLGSNTSTLPITSLAEGVQRRKDFIGLHFFSPVDKMPLLEIIRGEETSDEALARALDYAALIKKTPIVVNDSRGFFTSRVIGTFVNEALAMLGEGVHPATIEQATTQAGYPVGALQLADELNLELFLKIRNETRDAMGDAYVRHPAEDVVEKMVELGRAGKLAGKGFFDYDEAGKRTGLWSGLAETFPVKGNPADVDLHELGERMLVIEAVETARCVDENVLITTADANIGSIMGIGFPPWTGGVLQYVNGYEGSTGHGVAAFVQRAEQFAKAYGERFEPNQLLRDKAGSGEGF